MATVTTAPAHNNKHNNDWVNIEVTVGGIFVGFLNAPVRLFDDASDVSKLESALGKGTIVLTVSKPKEEQPAPF